MDFRFGGVEASVARREHAVGARRIRLLPEGAPRVADCQRPKGHGGVERGL
jgi:hypothetical protein